MNLNKPNTKFMEINFCRSGQVRPRILEDEIIERVTTVKLLAICIQDDLKWNSQRFRKLNQKGRHGGPYLVIKGVCFTNYTTSGICLPYVPPLFNSNAET